MIFQAVKALKVSCVHVEQIKLAYAQQLVPSGIFIVCSLITFP